MNQVEKIFLEKDREMSTKEYWRYLTNSRMYAVLIEDDVVVSCVGPLHYSEIGDLNDHDFADGIEDAAWCQENRSAFVSTTA